VLFYTVVRFVVAGGSRVAWRATIVGRERLPRSGGYVLAPSHRSMMDIPFAAAVVPRRIRYMGKSSVFEIPVLGWLFRALGGFPVERDGTDRKAVRDSVAMLQAGEVVVVYPEGTRQNGPKIQPLQPGAAYLALRAGAPIVPVGLAGTEEIVRSRRRRWLPGCAPVTIVVGEPLVPPPRVTSSVPRAAVDELTARLRESLQTAFDAAYAVRGRK